MRLKPATAVWGVAIAAGVLLAAPAHAKLPPPSAEQQAAAAQKKAEEAEKAREQQQALTRVQDRIASQFGRGRGSPGGAGQSRKENLPLKAVESNGGAGPTGGRQQSAEAHSTPAR